MFNRGGEGYHSSPPLSLSKSSLYSSSMKFTFRDLGGKKILIGAIHLPPLPGFDDFPGFDSAIENALLDLDAFEKGGVDAIIFENNYDLPHTELVGPEIVAAMTRVGAVLRAHSSLPMGVSVLWNDYRSALAIAKALDLQFVRVPVFVDTVKTSYGTIRGDAAAVVAFRKEIGADSVELCTDIHVKHAEILNTDTLIESATHAMDAGSDCLIVTGKWTGDAPDMTELSTLRDAVGVFPIICGSGVSSSNVQELFQYADGAIVSTSLKNSSLDTHAVNVKPYSDRIDRNKVRSLIEAL